MRRCPDATPYVRFHRNEINTMHRGYLLTRAHKASLDARTHSQTLHVVADTGTDIQIQVTVAIYGTAMAWSVVSRRLNMRFQRFSLVVA